MNAFATKTADTLPRFETHASSTGLMLSLANAFRGLAERARRRRTIAELNALSDRELADIGLTRGEIHQAVGGA